jgi:hypothetical protein
VAHWPGQRFAGTDRNACKTPQVQPNKIGFQKDGYRLARRLQHGLRMVQNDHIERSGEVPAMFAQITALIEDSHDIAARGQNSRLERKDYLEAANEIQKLLDQIQGLSKIIRLILR